jgi:hypothetical protein
MERARIWAGLLALGMVAGLAGGASAQAPAGWLHVRVEESGAKAGKVSVNLPLSVVEVALKAAPETLEHKGHLKLGDDKHQMSLDDARRIWAELRKAGDMDFVTVDQGDEHVQVARKGELVIVHVTKPGQKAEEVSVEVPVDLVDAMLSGTGEQVNVQAMLAQLQKRRGDIVRVKGDDANVRIWIDDQN